MRSRLAAFSGVIGIVAMTAGVSLTAQHDAGLAPTFNKDVAPIVFNNCANCHRPNQVAPMSLMSYREVRPWARAIKTKVTAGLMPPWYADPRYGEFKNDRSLTPEQLETLIAWVDAGAPEGDTPLTAKVPELEGGWSHPTGRPPDLVMEMADPFTLPAEGELPGFTIYQDLPRELKEKEHYLEAIQVMPGTLQAVHHAGFNIRVLPGVEVGTGEAWPGGPIINGALVYAETGEPYVGRGGEDAATEAVEASELRFCCYVPGGNFQQYPPGAGKRIDPRGIAGFQMHYTAIGQTVTDRTRVGLWFSDQKEMTAEIVFTGGNAHQHIINGKELIEEAFTPVKGSGAAAIPAVPVIPPGAKDWAITGWRVFQDDVTLYVVWPHMHLRGKEMTYVLTYPDGRERVVMSAPNYDFNWQIFYEFKEPIKISAGSTMKTIGSYDNSVANRWNPAPQKEVYWSEQSWDEMFIGVMEVSVDGYDPQSTKNMVKASHSVGGGD